MSDLGDPDPLIFRQCTFFFCDTKEMNNPNNSYLTIGIRVATEDKLIFIDCAFVGISYSVGGTKNTGVDFMMFTDCFSKINLQFESCYFTGAKSILYTNFAVRSLILNNCTFDSMQADCVHLTNPGKLLVTACQFLHCEGQSLHVRLFDQESQEKTTKKTSGFANSTKNDNSVVIFGYTRRTKICHLEMYTRNKSSNIILRQQREREE